MAILDTDLMDVLSALGKAVDAVTDAHSGVVEGMDLGIKLSVESYGELIATYYEEGWQV